MDSRDWIKKKQTMFAWNCGSFYTDLLIFLVILVSQRNIISESINNAAFSPAHSSSHQIRANLTFFWINLDSNPERKKYMEYLFSKHHIASHFRVPAVEPSQPEYKQLQRLEKPCGRNTPRDIAVILSHLKAIYSAVYFDSFHPDSEYAVILEDDVKFLYSMNFTALLETAPKDFTILQLTTSNPQALDSLWKKYSEKPNYKSSEAKEAKISSNQERFWHLTDWKETTKNKKTYLYWSAQAYIIHKQRILEVFLQYVLRTAGNSTLIPFTPINHLQYLIVNGFFQEKCTLTRRRPCILSNCLFSDSYIYAGGKPTYVSTIPLLTGAKVGLNSTIHQLEVDNHKEGFQKIKQITENLKNNIDHLEHPSFLLTKKT